jgi:predicted Fe-Mo cluster-binding NifX family protein
MARVCVPITESGEIDGHWGRAPRVAIADVEGGVVKSWQEFEVGWGDLHETDTEGGHHARIARFLRDHEVDSVVAQGMGPGMVEMLSKMGIAVHVGASGDARTAALTL